MATKHTQRRNVYHDCMRCGTTESLDNMQWQNGLLVCKAKGCLDKRVVGSRELAVARQVSIDRHELTPERKLVEPAARQNDTLDVLY